MADCSCDHCVLYRAIQHILESNLEVKLAYESIMQQADADNTDLNMLRIHANEDGHFWFEGREWVPKS